MFGLLGILVTVGIMVFLVVQVLDGTGKVSPGVDLGAGSGTETTVAGATTPPGAPTDPAQPSATTPIDAAARQRCLSDQATVRLAAYSYNAMNGAYPPDVQTLVTEGLLVPDGELNFELQVQGDTLAVVGTGPCAGI